MASGMLCMQTSSLCVLWYRQLLLFLFGTCRQLHTACIQDAAELYERAGLHEKAATIYIQCRAFALAEPLMTLITHNPKLQLEFAKAKESKYAPQGRGTVLTFPLAFAQALESNPHFSSCILHANGVK